MMPEQAQGAQKKRWNVPWTLHGFVTIEAENEEEATAILSERFSDRDLADVAEDRHDGNQFDAGVEPAEDDAELTPLPPEEA